MKRIVTPVLVSLFCLGSAFGDEYVWNSSEEHYPGHKRPNRSNEEVEKSVYEFRNKRSHFPGMVHSDPK